MASCSILDEVMCGMGRTGTLHACEQEGITPDLMAIAKGLGGGYAPIGAVLMQEKIFDAVADGSGAFQHSHTYHGSSARLRRGFGGATRDPSRRAARERARAGRPTLLARLKERFGNHPFVGDVRGRGLFQAR